MCMPSTPSYEQEIAVTPAAPTYQDASMGEEERARGKSRRKAAAALSTRSSMLAGDYSGGGGGKTLLGQ